MSKEQLLAFLAQATSDKSLQAKLDSMTDKNSLISLAAELGYIITDDDMNESPNYLSDKDLEVMSGGNKGPFLGDSCCGTAAQNPASCTASRLICGSKCK